MAFVMLWFIMVGGLAEYIEPMKIENPPCGITGAVVGLQIDSAVNPTKVMWPDPFFPGVHCEISIAAKIATLQPGDYTLATTEFTNGKFGGPAFNGIDPHVSTSWIRSLIDGTPSKPTTFKVVKPGDR